MKRGVRRSPRRHLVACATGLLLLAGCGDRDESRAAVPPPPVHWDRAAALVASAGDTVRIQVEVAETDEQRAYGLMSRDHLPEDAGMIFLHEREQPAEAAFWMFNTRIPLDIAYLDAGGRIVSIVQMQPCTSPYPQYCPTYPSGAPFQAALEMNLGWFERHGFRVGDQVTLLR
jgi:uncharacterized protein